jgi:hypothetical protein
VVMRPIENMENLRTSCTVMYVQTVEIRLLSTNSYLFLGVNLLSDGPGVRMTIDELQTLVRHSSVLATPRSWGQTMS